MFGFVSRRAVASVSGVETFCNRALVMPSIRADVFFLVALTLRQRVLASPYTVGRDVRRARTNTASCLPYLGVSYSTSEFQSDAWRHALDGCSHFLVVARASWVIQPGTLTRAIGVHSSKARG